MPVRGHSPDIPVDVLFAVAEGGDAFKERLARLAKAQEAARGEAEKSAGLSRSADAAMEEVVLAEQALADKRGVFEKSCVKARDKIDRDALNLANSLEQYEIRSTDLDHQKTVADARNETLDARDNDQNGRETALNAREAEQDARDTILDRRDGTLETRETRLNAEVADLNTRLNGFRVGA